MLDGDTYADRGIATRRGATNGENDGGIVVLPLVANKGDKAKTDKLRSHLRGFFATDDRCEITEPLECSESGKTVTMIDGLRSSRTGGLAISKVVELDALCTFVISGCRIDVLARRLGIVCLAADEATE